MAFRFFALLATFNLCLSASVSQPPAAPPSSALTESICPSRTANYITHGLPQQCLTSSWRQPPPSETPAPSNGTIIEALATHDPTPVLDESENAGTTLSQDVPPVVSATDTTSTSLTTTIESVTAEVVATSEAAALQTPIIEYASVEESMLEGANFLSFEDWKKQNLLKAGQSEHVGKDVKLEQHDKRKRPSGIQNALDSIGDDTEIELDFRGFVPSGPDTTAISIPNSGDTGHDNAEPLESSPRAKSRSKDAGTTCKERFNYASFDCAANVLKTNPKAKSASSVLVENKDAYMLNECSANDKFLIIELCNDISVDTIVLANFEFFSSIFREFRVSVSDKYPVKADKWKTLGTFEARNTREVQAFLVENPVIWARYLRIEFLSHYGKEFYCPLSLIRVHGTTMLEEYKHDLESSLSEDEEVEDMVAEARLKAHVLPDAVVVNPDTSVAESLSTELDGIIANTTSTAASTVSPSRLESHTKHEPIATSASTTSPFDKTLLLANMSSDPKRLGQCPIQGSRVSPPSSDVIGKETLYSTTTPPHSQITPTTSTVSTSVKPSPVVLAESSATRPPDPTRNDSISSSGTNTRPPMNATDDGKVKPSSTQSLMATPTMQESFFKSVQKRLQMLESNSSLSLQYIEEQSRQLSEAFSRVEQKQLVKTTHFLDYLNTSVSTQLRDFYEQYDQLWQATVIELQHQKEIYQRDNVAFNTRLGVLTDEVVFQRRLAMLQMILVVVCLLMVLFSRGTSYLELPLVQNMLARSPSSKRLNYFSSTSPTPTRPSSAGQSSLGTSHHRRMSDESPADIYPSSSPISYNDPLSAASTQHDGDGPGDPEFDPAEIERPSSSPPVLLNRDSPSTPKVNGIYDDGSIEGRILTPDSPDMSQRPLRVIVNEASPVSKHLTWQLPNG